MSSYRQTYYHIIFRPKNSAPVLLENRRKDLFNYIWGIIKEKKGFMYQINGMDDHIHILCDLNPSIALADYIRDIKTSTSVWIKKENVFPNFTGWAEGYCALTYSHRDKNMIINYIRNQQEHHNKVPFLVEYKNMIEENGLEINERFFP